MRAPTSIRWAWWCMRCSPAACPFIPTRRSVTCASTCWRSRHRSAPSPGLDVPPEVEARGDEGAHQGPRPALRSALEFAREFVQAAEAGSHLAAQPEPQREAAERQSQTTIVPVAKTSVPAVVRDTVTTKVVPEIAHPLRRQWLGSRWKRIGIIVRFLDSWKGYLLPR